MNVFYLRNNRTLHVEWFHNSSTFHKSTINIPVPIMTPVHRYNQHLNKYHSSFPAHFTQLFSYLSNTSLSVQNWVFEVDLSLHSYSYVIRLLPQTEQMITHQYPNQHHYRSCFRSSKQHSIHKHKQKQVNPLTIIDGSPRNNMVECWESFVDKDKHPRRRESVTWMEQVERRNWWRSAFARMKISSGKWCCLTN